MYVLALFLPVVRLFECCLFILVDPLPLVFSDLPTAIVTEKFQETGGHLAVLDFGDSLAPTENTMGLKIFFEFAFWTFHNSVFFLLLLIFVRRKIIKNYPSIIFLLFCLS